MSLFLLTLELLKGEVLTIDSIAESLFTATVVRERCREIYELARHDELKHFQLEQQNFSATTKLVINTISEMYPNHTIPFHSRWRHFETGGVNRWKQLTDRLTLENTDRLRVKTEVTILSVLLDGGAGASWHFKDPLTGQILTRSEGLGVASLLAYFDGAFSSDPQSPLQADMNGLSSFNKASLVKYFQITKSNPLVGLSGRVALINGLGKVISKNCNSFSGSELLGNLRIDTASSEERKSIDAAELLKHILKTFCDIWPGRIHIGGIPLGDVWHHSAISRNDDTNLLLPLHKLSQWMTYSLLEVYESENFLIENHNKLTGLAEYRNGGLFLDTELLRLRDPAATSKEHYPSDELIVEWRALTVALLDEIAIRIRHDLKMNEKSLPLIKILEGGTWQAGRKTAQTLRKGHPPLRVISDGTVF